jgi:uncharacterized protein with NAD-binding domain and iron-sulfur cluster
MLGHLRDWLWENFSEAFEADPHARLFFTIFDFFASSTIGIVDDEILKEGWETINDLDLCQWLQKHGAKEVTVGPTPGERSPLLRSIYDVAFGYPEGDIKKANVAAGTAMNDYLRMQFSYRGSLMYKMQAGMGDTVLTPLYQMLKDRGVQFKFFHAVTELRLTDDGSQVSEIEFVKQVEGDVDGYDPLVNVEKLECWPSEPQWDRLPGGKKLEHDEHDFEQETDPLGLGPQPPLHLGADFDHVVLGIPVGALHDICADIAFKHPPFDKMLKSSVTVRTQAFQLWLAQPPTALGWAHSQNSVAGCYVEPIDTWCDMTHLLDREEWNPRDGVAGIAYFCGVLDELPGETAEEATERVKATAEAFLGQHVGPLWPKAVARVGGMDWWALADPGRSTQGPARLASQYFRANISGSERYVLTPAGSVQHRLGAGQSGVANLVLAGDWTRNGIDGGCVEAAVTSGLQAGQYLTGVKHDLVGESPTWLSDPNPGTVAMPWPLAAGGSIGRPGAAVDSAGQGGAT